LNRYTDVILCASDAIRRQWDNKKVAGRIKVVSPYFDPSELQQSERLGTRSGSTEKRNWVIGMVGRLSEEKRHIDVINAFYEVSKVFPEARLLIVGDGEMKDRLLKVVTRRNLSRSVIFAGFVKDLSEYLNRMDIFVLASRTEGFPVVLLEAMAMGLPVIATRVGGIPELIRDNETGFLVRPFRYKELSRAILNVLSDPTNLHIVGERGKKYVFSTFSAEKFVHERERVYESALTIKGLSQIHGGPAN
jgi:glycosyltransferase involved in cell wall biosynthesis